MRFPWANTAETDRLVSAVADDLRRAVIELEAETAKLAERIPEEGEDAQDRR